MVEGCLGNDAVNMSDERVNKIDILENCTRGIR